MKLTHVDAFGYHFSNGRFCKSAYQHTHVLANTIVQIKPCNNYFGIFLMQENNVITNNTAWKEFNKYRYLANELRTVFGSYDQRPSCVNLKPLKVFMLTTSIAEQLLTTNLLYLSEREYKDVNSLIKVEYLSNFKYELPSKTIQLPTETVDKQRKDFVKTEQSNNLLRVGSQLIQRPVRKAG